MIYGHTSKYQYYNTYMGRQQALLLLVLYIIYCLSLLGYCVLLFAHISYSENQAFLKLFNELFIQRTVKFVVDPTFVCILILYVQICTGEFYSTWYTYTSAVYVCIDTTKHFDIIIMFVLILYIIIIVGHRLYYYQLLYYSYYLLYRAVLHTRRENVSTPPRLTFPLSTRCTYVRF